MGERLSDERLAEIEAAAKAMDLGGAPILDLVDEVRRLRAALADQQDREVLSIDEHGEDAALGRDFYRCPNTGEWVYQWADERIVGIDTLELRAIQARADQQDTTPEPIHKRLGISQYEAINGAPAPTEGEATEPAPTLQYAPDPYAEAKRRRDTYPAPPATGEPPERPPLADALQAEVYFEHEDHDAAVNAAVFRRARRAADPTKGTER